MTRAQRVAKLNFMTPEQVYSARPDDEQSSATGDDGPIAVADSIERVVQRVAHLKVEVARLRRLRAMLRLADDDASRVAAPEGGHDAP